MFMTNFFLFKMVISYNGSDYSGWQRQSSEYSTIQGEIEKTIQKLLKTRDFHFFGSSRTDTGVHASGQVALLKSNQDLKVETFLFQLNQQLPDSIRVLKLSQVEDSFNPQVNLYSKEYHYFFSLAPVTAHNSPFVLELHHELNIELMQKACEFLKGEHDFAKFTTDKLADNKTIRKIFNCEIKLKELSFQESMIYQFNIEGSGFLKYMVRNIFSHLLKVGSGDLALDQFKSILDCRSDTRVKKAPAKGLHLVRINYSGK